MAGGTMIRDGQGSLQIDLLSHRTSP
jgi:hypothetical protein